MALGINYRLGPAEISALELFDDHNQAQVLYALIDWPRVLELSKKNKLQGAGS